MSTRCNIVMKMRDERIYLYHHCDGNPEGVGSNLKAMLDHAWDRSYFFQYLRHLATEMVRGEQVSMYCEYTHNPNNWMDFKPVLNEDGKPYLRKDMGYEITFGLHGDIDYCYVFNAQAKTLRCYRVPKQYKTEDERMERIFKRCNLVEIPTDTDYDYYYANKDKAYKHE